MNVLNACSRACALSVQVVVESLTPKSPRRKTFARYRCEGRSVVIKVLANISFSHSLDELRAAGGCVTSFARQLEVIIGGLHTLSTAV